GICSAAASRPPGIGLSLLLSGFTRWISSRPAASTEWSHGRIAEWSMSRLQPPSRCPLASIPMERSCARRAVWESALAMAELATDALWRFSLAFYAAPGVAEALLTLQDEEGLDVNQMLFALWFGLSGRGRLDKDALAAADRAVGTIRTNIVEPLRSLRKRL